MANRDIIQGWSFAHTTYLIMNVDLVSGLLYLKLVLINVIILSGCSWVFFGKLLVVNWTPQSILSSECIRSYKTYKYHTGVRSWFKLELQSNLCDIWQSSWTHSYSRITHTPISLGHDTILYRPKPQGSWGQDKMGPNLLTTGKPHEMCYQ